MTSFAPSGSKSCCPQRLSVIALADMLTLSRPLGPRDPESFEANKTIAVAIGVFASSVVLFSQFADLLVPA